MRALCFSLLLVLLSGCVKKFPDMDTEVYGHAGESIIKFRSKYPPNTLESIDYSLNNLGADGVEVDVQMTSDNILVLYHDLNLGDYTEIEGCINNMPYSEVKEIKVYGSDRKIPLLKDAIELIMGRQKKIMLDVKHFNSCTEQSIDVHVFNQQLNNILEDLSDEQKQRISVNSTSLNLLNTITDSEVVLSYESDDLEKALDYAVQYNFDMLCFKLEYMNDDIRQQIRSKGIDLIIYGIKSKTDIKNALQFAPEFVISDNIENTLKSLDG